MGMLCLTGVLHLGCNKNRRDKAGIWFVSDTSEKLAASVN